MKLALTFTLILIFASCTTMKTTITRPDGSVVTTTTTSQDPAVVTAIVTGVTNGTLNYLKSDK